MEDIFIGDFKITGQNTIDVKKVAKKWNHLWRIFEWRRDNSFRLVKYIRKDSPKTAIKTTISPQQAKELITELNLKQNHSSIFARSFTWQKEE